MGAFNVIKINHVCKSCKINVMIQVQFKYGDIWQYEYSLGDSLKWGGNDTGVSGRRKVIVDGVSEGSIKLSINTF